MTNLKVALILVLACLFAIFIVQNVALIEMRFLVWNFFMSRALLAFFSLIAGFIIGWFASSLICWRKAKASRAEENV